MPGAAPALSVVVAAWTDAASLGRCLASLREQQRSGDIEVLVARNFDVDAAVALAEFPSAIDIPMPARTTVPALRAAGLRRARGGVVAFLEDHCTCVPGWAEALARAHAAPVAAVGGPVEQGPGASALDWAVYFYDYGRYMPPLAAGHTQQLSGLNMSFKRSVLETLAEELRDGVFEADLQAALRTGGRPMVIEPGALVVHRRRHGTREAVRRAYNLGRGYAARRLAGAEVPTRALYGLAAALLPALMLGRIGVGVLRKRRHRAALVRAFPWLLVLVVAWSAGEGAGYLAGTGVSAAEWR